MDIERDLARIAEQEARLTFEHFDAQVAWSVGQLLRERALRDSLSIAFDISFGGTTLLYVSMSGATPDNADWIRRKKNSVARFHKSSYAVGLELEQRGATLAQRFGVSPSDFVAAGGCFPVRLRGSSGVLGSVTVSGLAQRDDHDLVVWALAQFLEVDEASVALASPRAQAIWAG